MVDERTTTERCPDCGMEMYNDIEVVHDPGSRRCLRNQLAQAQEQLQQALAREAELRRVVEAVRRRLEATA